LQVLRFIPSAIQSTFLTLDLIFAQIQRVSIR